MNKHFQQLNKYFFCRATQVSRFKMKATQVCNWNEKTASALYNLLWIVLALL